MAIEHVGITDPDIHEPKGVSTALAGQVYVADGAGSGAFTAQVGQPSNVVTVESLSDLPTPVTGFITLAASTVYQITGVVDIGANRLVFQHNTSLSGRDPFLDGITSSTTDALITANSASIAFHSVRLAAAAGTIFDFAGGGSGNALRCETLFIFACDSLGTVENAGLFTFRKSFFLPPTTSGLTFAGTTAEGTLKISDSTLYSGTAATAIDLGVATFESVFIGPNNTFVTDTGGTGLSIAAASANIIADGIGIVHVNSFEGTGTFVSAGYSLSDLRWAYSENNGLPNTFKAASCYVEGNATATTFAGIGVANIVNVDFGAGMTTDFESQFTVDTAGKLTYIGDEETIFRVTATLFGEIAGGASRQYVYYFAKNGVYQPGSVSKTEHDGSNPGSNTVSGMLSLATNDYVELQVYAVTAATDLTVNTANLTIQS